MTTLVTTRRARPRGAGTLVSASATVPRPSRFGVADGEQTLAEAIAGVWEELAVRASVGCPVCGGEMQAESAAHGLRVSGRCHDCGTAIA